MLASDALFASFFPAPTRARLRRLTAVERLDARRDPARLAAALARCDAIVTTWHSPRLTAAMLAASPARLIVHCGGELAARMEPAVLDRIAVTHTPEPMAPPVAEMALAATLALVRRLADHSLAMRRGASPRNDVATEGETLAGRRVGIVGFGRIGRAFARLVAPLGAELVVHDPYGDRRALRSARARPLALDSLLRTSSVVVLTAALTRETRGLISRRRLRLLRDGAVLVNVARGGLVDLAALTAELERGRLRAALDVTDPLEPLPRRHPLRRLPNVLLTPHVAAGGIEVRRAMGAAAVEALERFAAGRPPRRVVTRAELARMT